MRFPASAPANACGRCVRTADGDRTSTDAMTLPRITRSRLRLADSTSGSSGIPVYTVFTVYTVYTVYCTGVWTGETGRTGKTGRTSFQQARHPSIGVNLASGLTGGTVVGFLIGIVDRLDACAAARARLARVPVPTEQLDRLARPQPRPQNGPVVPERGGKNAPGGGGQPGPPRPWETRG